MISLVLPSSKPCHITSYKFDIKILLILSSCRRGPTKYKFQAQYELDSLAVVNVRDLGNVKHAFKLLAFPDSRVFQCSSNSAKVLIHHKDQE